MFNVRRYCYLLYQIISICLIAVAQHRTKKEKYAPIQCEILHIPYISLYLRNRAATLTARAMRKA